MNRISFYHLETLLWINRLGTFAAAAERLNTTQPGVSARIRELEHQIGFPLFQRAGRTMALTVRGRRFVEQCEPLWDRIEDIVRPSDQMADASGIVRIGAGEIAAATCLPPFFAALKQAMPRISLDVEIDLTHGLLQKLLGATCDLIFLAGPTASPTIETAPIGEAPLIWVARAGASPLPDPADPQTPLWLLHRHSPIRAVAVDCLTQAGIAPVAINTCNNVRALIDVVASGGGVSFVPEQMARNRMVRGELVEIRPDLRRSIPFHAAIRAQERDPVVRDIFRRAGQVMISDGDRRAAIIGSGGGRG